MALHGFIKDIQKIPFTIKLKKRLKTKEKVYGKKKILLNLGYIEKYKILNS